MPGALFNMENVSVASESSEQLNSPGDNKRQVNWTESDWFKQWLYLAQRDYHGQILVPRKPHHQHHR